MYSRSADRTRLQKPLAIMVSVSARTARSILWASHDERIDYPAPASLSKDLFTFEVPREAELEVNDPALGRLLYSEGQVDAEPRTQE